jgi:hypothetical protein
MLTTGGKLASTVHREAAAEAGEITETNDNPPPTAAATVVIAIIATRVICRPTVMPEFDS